MTEIHRDAAVFNEIKRAVKYLRNGLAEVQKISGANDFYDPALLFLSSGLERLLKSMLCLSFKEKHERFPKIGEIWSAKTGHDIVFLKTKVEKICVPTNLPFIADDCKIITNDPDVNRICEILAKFGMQARYFNIDVILGHEQSFNSVEEWELLESEIVKSHFGEAKYHELITSPNSLDTIYDASKKHIVQKLELFFRALTRQFIHGNFYGESKTFWFEIDDFSDMDDDQIGTTDYCQFQNHERIKRSKKLRVR